MWLLLLLVSLASAELQPRCGDCWCINGDDACPTDTTGIADVFPAEDFQVFSTFTLTNPDAPYLKLQAADGGECYPFADTLGPINDYPKSNLPPCVIPTSTDSTVCAYLYEEGNECQGRNYQIITYDSSAEAEAAGAVVTHSGGAYAFVGRYAVLSVTEPVANESLRLFFGMLSLWCLFQFL